MKTKTTTTKTIERDSKGNVVKEMETSVTETIQEVSPQFNQYRPIWQIPPYRIGDFIDNGPHWGDSSTCDSKQEFICY